MIIIGQGITLGPGVRIGDIIAPPPITYFITEDNNNLITEVGDQDFIEEN
jgi:hypothetical protein